MINWETIEKASKQLESKMKNAHNEINELTFTGSSEDKHIKVMMKGSYKLERLAIAPEVIDSAKSSADMAEYLNAQCTIAFNDAINQIQEYSNERIAKLAGDLEVNIADESEEKYA